MGCWCMRVVAWILPCRGLAHPISVPSTLPTVLSSVHHSEIADA